MTGMAALAICAAFTSCSKDTDVYNSGVVNENNAVTIVEQYNQKFLKYVGANSVADIPSNQTWGFGGYAKASTRANAGENYPQTSTGINANANEWADPNKEFGGWVVPDPLTDTQKAVVAAYFQANTDLDYDDPEWRHFFVQQVYKGGKTTVGNTTEGIIAANGSSYSSDNMNLLTVGANNQHINNFNAGNCSTTSVLDNGQNVGGSSHNDQIMLMVNIDDTSCMGYHETGSSTHHNDKAALVDWETIRTWANANGLNGDCLDDGWDRSFVGFDLAIKEGADALDATTVKYNDGPESYNYALVNGEVVSIDGNSEILINGEPIKYASTNTNMYVAAEKTNMGDGDIQAEYRVGGQYMGKYINVDNIMAKLNAGWIPVKDKNLREWVKIGTSDGYFSDWIVTLTEAERINQDSDPDDVCIIAEDLTIDDDTDFDFNDVVFTVHYTSDTEADITLYAAGGTLPLTVAGTEVHAKFGYAEADSETGKYKMINTGAKADVNDVATQTFHVTGINKSERGKDIEIKVNKGTAENPNWIELTATGGAPAAKLCVGTDFATEGKWCAERESIKTRYQRFSEWVLNNPTQVWWK